MNWKSIFGATTTTGLLVFTIAAAFAGTASLSANGDEKAFIVENDVAMRRMMADMAVTPSGDVDRDFVAMMVPHHQGAVDMARLELRYGKNEALRRLAQEIVVTQSQEIVAMQLALERPPASAPAGSSAMPAARSGVLP